MGVGAERVSVGVGASKMRWWVGGCMLRGLQGELVL